MIMKKIFIVLSLMFLCATFGINAQKDLAEQAKKDILETSKFGGYVIGRAAFNDRDLSTSNKSHSNFDLRLVRAYVDGKMLNFAYKLQVEYEGYGGTNEKGPHIVDAWAEWQKYSFFRVKVGQFKRCFTFENPMNPWDISFGDYSQLVQKMAGFSDRVGEHSSGGRDGGVQIQGDLFPSRKDGHAFLHYQLGVYNGQGINHNDINNHKDVIGNIAISPVKNLTVAFFGWSGNYTGTVSSQAVTVDRNRMAAGIRYTGPFIFCAEYGVSEGHKVSDYVYDVNNGLTLKPNTSDGADTWYIMSAVPVTKDKKLKVQARWDVYRDQKTWNSAKRIYGLGSEYYFSKNLKIQANYNFISDKSTSAIDQHYNSLDLQLYWRW